MTDSKDKSVVWCNQDIDASVSTSVAGDFLGEDYTLLMFPDCKDRHQRFYVTPAFTDEDKEHLIRFINDLVIYPIDLSEYWCGHTEDEEHTILLFTDDDNLEEFEYGDIRIYLAVEDPEEYEL